MDRSNVPGSPPISSVLAMVARRSEATYNSENTLTLARKNKFESRRARERLGSSFEF